LFPPEVAIKLMHHNAQIKGSDRPLGFQEVEAPRIIENWQMKAARLLHELFFKFFMHILKKEAYLLYPELCYITVHKLA
jgi:hypothetical protein